MGNPCCFYHFIICGIQLTIADIVCYRTGEQVRILNDHGKRTSQVIFSDIPYIYAIICDLSRLNIIESVDEIHNCSLAGSRRTYESNLLPRLGKQ